MAYFYNSNYSENHGNYQYYDQYYYNHEPRYVHQDYTDTEFYGNAYQHATTPSLVGYYYSDYNQPEFYTFKNINLQENDEYDPVSTQYLVSYNSTTVEEADDIVEKVDVPKTFHGGYDIAKEYGKPLPPSEEICYPPAKYDPKASSIGDANFGAIPSPYLKEDKKELVSENKTKNSNDSGLIPEENPSDFEDDEEDEEDDSDDEDLEQEKQDDSGKEPSNLGPIVPLVGVLPTKEAQNLEGEAKGKDSTSVGEVIQGKGERDLDQPNTKNESPDEYEEGESESGGQGEGEGGADLDDEVRNEEGYGDHVRRQIPPGYGMEAYDICEGLFGGYFPCLWKRNQRIYNHQRDGNEKMSDYDYCGKETADYFFGNPNPYGGTMPEKGSYGDPVYSYQRHYPQQPITRQVQNYGQNYSSYLQDSRYFYGYHGQY